ncbi:MAG: 50S ribosomal protein L25 [Verrucomicrobiota bacterium]
MATETTIKAELRARTGSGRLNQMRREGWLPSVIYGRGVENRNLKVDAKTFSEVIASSSSENIVVNLEIAGEGKKLAFLKSIQHDPLSGAALHADFLAINEKTAITAPIPVHLKGESPGVKAGGVVEQYVHSLEVSCLPGDLPDGIDVDVAKLELGDSLHIGDLKLPKGVEATHGADVVIVHIGKPRVEEPAAEVAGAAAPVAEKTEAAQ